MLRPLLLSTVLSACAANAPTPDLVHGTDAVVAIAQLRIPDTEPWYSRFARHSWVTVRAEGEQGWLRYEVVNEHSGLTIERLSAEEVLATERWDRPVDLLRVVRGAEAARAGQRLAAFARDYDDSIYRAWPGPNSNTFAEGALRAMGIGAELDHNAVGKDWAWFRAGRSGTGSGVELETPLLGAQIGLEEGLELHLLQLCVGVDLWPPAIKLPILPRIGWR